MQEAKVLCAGGLAGEEETVVEAGAEVLVLLEGGAGGPIGITAVGPGLGTPPGIIEGDRFGDVGGTEHVSEDGEGLLFRFLVGLRFDAGALVLGDGCENNARAWEESRGVKGLPYRVITTLRWICVEKKLSVFVPKDFVWGEL